MSRFAPDRSDRIRAVIFDMDGTLTRPCLDFDAIRAEMGLEREPILEAMARMTPEARARARADAILVRVEAEAAANSELNDGALETVRALVRHGIGTALLTRNSRASADTVLARHELSFSHVHTRENGPLKPDPAPVRTLCEALGVTPAETLMVGDYLFDIQAGSGSVPSACWRTNSQSTRHPHSGHRSLSSPDKLYSHSRHRRPVSAVEGAMSAPFSSMRPPGGYRQTPRILRDYPTPAERGS